MTYTWKWEVQKNRSKLRTDADAEKGGQMKTKTCGNSQEKKLVHKGVFCDFFPKFKLLQTSKIDSLF